MTQFTQGGDAHLCTWHGIPAPAALRFLPVEFVVCESIEEVASCLLRGYQLPPGVCDEAARRIEEAAHRDS